MTHTYSITGMTCDGCATTVRNKILSVSGVTDARVDLEHQQAEISMSSHIPISQFQNALSKTKYSIEEKREAFPILPATATPANSDAKLKTYLPIFLIFGYITAVTLIIQATHGAFHFEEWMQHFMAGFFLTFSFFKLLDVPAFAESYSTYDIIAKRWMRFGYVYPFLELTLGILFLIPSLHVLSNVATLLLMGVSIIGVLQAVFSKRAIRCACLGAVFNLPMSTITIIEDALMIVMSAISLILYF